MAAACRPWRQFAGFGSARDTKQRFKFLLEHGQTGLSTAFDFPTLMGYDSDHSRHAMERVFGAYREPVFF